MKKLLAFYLFAAISSVLFPLGAAAQDDIEMADMMRSDGKIYVVVAVLAIILAGLLIYLIRIDRKVSKIENSRRKE